MRLKVFLFVTMLFCGIRVIAQQTEASVKAPVEPKQEVVYVHQVDNSDLANKVASLEKEIDRYRDDLSLWLALFVAIITIVAGVVGVIFPLYYTNRADRKLTEKVEKSIVNFETKSGTAMTKLQNESNTLIKEIQAEKDTLEKLMADSQETIIAIQKDIQEKGEEAIEEVRKQTRAKAEAMISKEVSSGLMETFAQGKKEAESKTSEENV